MTICNADENSIVFTDKGGIRFGLLSNEKYNLVIINPFEYGNKKILENICIKLEDLYNKGLIDSQKLVLRLNCKNSARINEFNPIFDIVKQKGFCQIEFINNNLHYNSLIDELLKAHKASLCYKMNYGEQLDEDSLQNLKTYLENAKNKEDVNVHCVINDAVSANDNGIQEFIKFMYKIGINKIGLRLDEKYLDTYSSCVLPDTLNLLFINFFKTAKKYSFFVDVKNKEQNEFLRKLCKERKIKRLSLCQKIFKFILRRKGNNEV